MHCVDILQQILHWRGSAESRPAVVMVLPEVVSAAAGTAAICYAGVAVKSRSANPNTNISDQTNPSKLAAVVYCPTVRLVAMVSRFHVKLV